MRTWPVPHCLRPSRPVDGRPTRNPASRNSPALTCSFPCWRSRTMSGQATAGSRAPRGRDPPRKTGSVPEAELPEMRGEESPQVVVADRAVSLFERLEQGVAEEPEIMVLGARSAFGEGQFGGRLDHCAATMPPCPFCPRLAQRTVLRRPSPGRLPRHPFVLVRLAAPPRRAPVLDPNDLGPDNPRSLKVVAPSHGPGVATVDTIRTCAPLSRILSSQTTRSSSLMMFAEPAPRLPRRPGGTLRQGRRVPVLGVDGSWSGGIGT